MEIVIVWWSPAYVPTIFFSKKIYQLWPTPLKLPISPINLPLTMTPETKLSINSRNRLKDWLRNWLELINIFRCFRLCNINIILRVKSTLKIRSISVPCGDGRARGSLLLLETRLFLRGWFRVSIWSDSFLKVIKNWGKNWRCPTREMMRKILKYSKSPKKIRLLRKKHKETNLCTNPLPLTAKPLSGPQPPCPKKDTHPRLRGCSFITMQPSRTTPTLGRGLSPTTKIWWGREVWWVSRQAARGTISTTGTQSRSISTSWINEGWTPFPRISAEKKWPLLRNADWPTTETIQSTSGAGAGMHWPPSSVVETGRIMWQLGILRNLCRFIRKTKCTDFNNHYHLLLLLLLYFD